MRRIERPEDRMTGVVTFELGDGRRVRLRAEDVERVGVAEVLRACGLGDMVPVERVVVMQSGKRVGTVPGDFDPLSIRSASFLYDPRRGDFRRDGDVWIADRMLGPGDLLAVPGLRLD